MFCVCFAARCPVSPSIVSRYATFQTPGGRYTALCKNTARKRTSREYHDKPTRLRRELLLRCRNRPALVHSRSGRTFLASLSRKFSPAAPARHGVPRPALPCSHLYRDDPSVASCGRVEFPKMQSLCAPRVSEELHLGLLCGGDRHNGICHLYFGLCDNLDSRGALLLPLPCC
jgi:hypothetical protein